MEKLKVVPLGVTNLLDVPECMRRVANDIESGEEPEAVSAVMVTMDSEGRLTIYGWGKTDSRTVAVGMLQRAVHELC